MNPFDLRTIVMAKYAQHVVLIHFPIALCEAVMTWSNKSRIPVEILGVLVIGLTAHLGGFLSGINS